MIEKFTIWLSEKVIDSLKKQSTNAQFPLYLSPGVAAVQRGQKLGLIHLPLGFPSNEIAFCREWGLKKHFFSGLRDVFDGLLLKVTYENV